MRRLNKTMKTFIVSIAIALISTNIVMGSTSHFSQNIYEKNVRADIIEYVYEVRGGKLYKRLYNYSKEEWIGDWILCE